MQLIPKALPHHDLVPTPGDRQTHDNEGKEGGREGGIDLEEGKGRGGKGNGGEWREGEGGGGREG